MNKPSETEKQPTEPRPDDPQAESGESIDDVRAELDEMRDRLLRSQAELENYRRRARRELDDELRYANVPLIRDLLPVIDNVQRAVAAAEKNADANSLLEGFKMVAKQLDEVLARHHCTPIEALHEPFDPNRHEALLQQPHEEHPPGTVIGVAQSGYQLRDRVVRPTQVIVAAQSTATEEND